VLGILGGLVFLYCLGLISKIISAESAKENPKIRLQYLTSALALLGETRNSQYANLLIQRAGCYFNRNDYEKALLDLNAALECPLDSDCMKARLLHNRGMVHLKNNQAILAVQDFEAASTCKFDNADLRRDINDALGKLKAGLKHLKSKRQSAAVE
jgi:tetratricopeptide (TPR) repeat protein